MKNKVVETFYILCGQKTELRLSRGSVNGWGTSTFEPCLVPDETKIVARFKKAKDAAEAVGYIRKHRPYARFYILERNKKQTHESELEIFETYAQYTRKVPLSQRRNPSFEK